MFRERRIAVGIPFSICLRKTPTGAKYYEVLNLQGVQSIVQSIDSHLAATSSPNGFEELPSELERQLLSSIQQQKAQRAPNLSQSTPATPATTTIATVEGSNQGALPQQQQQQPYLNALTTISQSSLSQLLGGCLIAAIDAVADASIYAQNKGINLHLTESSMQDLTTSLLIHLQRMAELECRYGSLALHRSPERRAAGQ
jgi:hypothetical protein